MDKSTKLVSAAQMGDRRAQNELYDLLKPILESVCRLYCRTNEDVEDVMTEAFVRIFKNLGKYVGTSMAELVAWARAITKNRAVDAIRYRMSDKHRGFNVEYHTLEGEFPSVESMASLDTRHIISMMSAMPKQPRTVFTMREIEGYKYSELVGMLGMSMTALKTNYHRARKWLMARLEADWKKADAKR